MAKEPLSADERKKILETRLKSIGVAKGQIISGSKFDYRHQDYVPTGQPEIDENLGGLPGFAQGSLIELIGESGSGKTYLALKIAAEAQKKGLKVAFFNIENSFYEPRANAIGVITRDENLFEMIPNLGSGEKMCDIIIAMIESGLYGLIIIDSITALIPEDTLSKNFDQPRKIGAHATLVSALASKLTYLTGEKNVSAICINQYRFGAGAMPNSFVKKPTGGESLLFFDHYRLAFKKITGEKGGMFKDGQKIGGRSEVTIVKNRFGPPDTKVIFPIYFTDEESDPISDWIMRSKAKFTELIKESKRDGLKYVTEDGEVIASKSPREFIELLKMVPAPSTKSKKDPSSNAFEFICNKIKFDEKMVNALMEKLNKSDNYELPNELIDPDVADPLEDIEE